MYPIIINITFIVLLLKLNFQFLQSFSDIYNTATLSDTLR